MADRTGLDQAQVSRAERHRENPRFDTVDRILAGTGHRLYAAPTRRDDAATVAASIRRSLADGDARRALRHLIQLSDDLAAERGLVCGVLSVAEPELTGHKLWDAAVAAVVEWRLNAEGLPHPEWLSQPTRRVARRSVLSVDDADPPPPPTEVPQEFRRRGVLVWPDTFASV